MDNNTMLADKILVVSSHQVFRRIKDIYDIYVLAKLYYFRFSELNEQLHTKHPNAVLENYLIPDNAPDLMHAYNAYTGIVHKPKLSAVLTVCNNFLQPFYEQNGGNLIWDPNETMWVSL